MSKMLAVTNATFKEKVLSARGFVLVDVYADWCGPCTVFTPILEKLQADFPKVKFFKLDAEKAKTLCNKYDLAALPTVLLFHAGELIARSEGAVSRATFSKWLAKHTKTT